MRLVLGLKAAEVLEGKAGDGEVVHAISGS
jgi:hypothetical protein